MSFIDYTLTPEIKRILLYIGLSVGSLFTIFGIILAKAKSTIKPYLKALIIYALLFALGIGITTFVATYAIPSNYTILFISLQVISLLWGIANRYALPKYMKWHSETTFGLDVLYSVAVGTLGAIAFILVYRIVNKENMELYLSFAFLTFPLPILVLQTFRKAIEIPPKVFKLWYYPVHQQEARFPDDKLLKNMLVISFEFKKQEQDSHYTNFRAKAPVDMELGELFYYFINDYNDRHPQEKIIFKDKNLGAPYGWLFYKKPKWYTLFTQYIDAEKTTFINSIKENDIIVCHRAF
ncbi:MAG: hypothetical protein DI598_04090 [Pseudopedobacter saltans]|uniref:TssN family type VI secretion system protein n=1 Tax=Pseudopedobacter saltans TaxID=151895 RepID=A0A2W5F6P2_9SPHI|nr:MAG: hypothetical protein DI598_04090 [Pseudopedobacter saltans]